MSEEHQCNSVAVGYGIGRKQAGDRSKRRNSPACEYTSFVCFAEPFADISSNEQRSVARLAAAPPADAERDLPDAKGSNAAFCTASNRRGGHRK